jgi:hypothetical protein
LIVSSTSSEDCHPGHRRYIGGFLDGMVEHLVYVTPSDFPMFIRYPNGSLYERDLDGGTEGIYRLATDDDRKS